MLGKVSSDIETKVIHESCSSCSNNHTESSQLLVTKDSLNNLKNKTIHKGSMVVRFDGIEEAASNSDQNNASLVSVRLIRLLHIK